MSWAHVVDASRVALVGHEALRLQKAGGGAEELRLPHTPYRTADGWTQACVTVEDRRPKVSVRGSTVQGRCRGP